jgi:CHASE3 domain sensor protein
LNFGIRTLREQQNPDLLAQEISRYDATDAAEVSRRIRNVADLGSVIDDTIDLYRSVIDEFKQQLARDPLEENRAAAEYLRWLTVTGRRRQADREATLTNSATWRLRNQLGRLH